MCKGNWQIKLSLSKNMKVIQIFLFVVSALFFLAHILLFCIFVAHKVSIYEVFFLPYKQDAMLSDFYFILGLRTIKIRLLLFFLNVFVLLSSTFSLFKNIIEITDNSIIIYFAPWLVKKEILFKNITSIETVNISEISFINKLKNLEFRDGVFLKIKSFNKEYILAIKDISCKEKLINYIKTKQEI